MENPRQHRLTRRRHRRNRSRCRCRCRSRCRRAKPPRSAVQPAASVAPSLIERTFSPFTPVMFD
ncbi:hypothetical protein E3T27_10610 [Cryobacterium lyxosi]|uniref:Uncharacterized protein n=1 Tax=Cryobacterium lyxosi TaxID=1259228 RepID=A0A4R8ZFZ2_9MICO|nr:hypothetical protein E3T27_10610 [Cryobacterium lyxosi]